jgi:hypothetical protein
MLLLLRRFATLRHLPLWQAVAGASCFADFRSHWSIAFAATSSLSLPCSIIGEIHQN